MATTKTLISNLNSLLCNDIISLAEHSRMKKRILKAEAQAAEAAEIQALVEPLREFMTADMQYKISDLVLGVLGIKAPCHGIKETEEQRKHRDGIVKPRVKRALELLEAQSSGTGAQTVYFIPAQLPALVTLDEVEDESEES